MEKEENILHSFLKILKIKHTSIYCNRLFEEHPYKNSLYGLSDMLKEYGLDSVALQYEGKDRNLICSLDGPFVACVQGKFIIVLEINKENVVYFKDKKYHMIPFELFNRMWNGAILFVDTEKMRIEPNYEKHFWKAVSNKIAVVCCLFFVIMSFFIFNNHVISLALSGFICLNLIGLIVSLFLLEKQIYKDSTYGDKICSLLGEKQCGEVLELEVSKLWKTDFSWSEIGVAYFFTNTFIAVYVEDWLPYVYVLNLLSLPYPIWSIGYQKFVAKKWCILCVIVQIVILSIFIYNLSWNVFQFSGLQLWLFLIVGSLYMSILWVVNRISYLLKSEMEKRVISYQSNSVKMMPSVFKAILKTNKNYDMGKDVSHIVIGNPKAKLNIVILTNPYCNPCSDVCRDVVSLIDRIDINRISLQFVFMVFEESLKNIATLLISAYMSKGWEFFMDIYQRWYQEGKEKGEDFFHQYGVFVNKESQEEYRLHEAWIQKMEFNQTPMIFVNGYRLPHNYSILELRHFLD